MTDKQPALFDWATELSDAQGHVTLSEQEAHEIGARLRSMGEKLKAHEDLDEAADDVQLLRTGYAAARLEIESLQARIKTMAEEHADELTVAHLDGRMRAAQPAGAQQPGAAYAALPYKQALGSTNCMQCCVSYMIGLPLENVPDFATDGGWERFSDFAETQGYVAVMLPGNHEFEADYLASGTTERGTPHMVVMNDGKLVHDPHPSNAGLVEVQCVWLLAKKSGSQWHHDERAAFEASAKTYTSNVSFERDASDYVDMTASLLWHGWKLRASHGQAPARADMQDAYVGAREDLAIWKRRALEAERDLRAERETASRLAAEINAINGPTHLGEPAPTAQPAPAATSQADSAPLAAPDDTVVLEAALRAIHQAIDLIGEPDTERLRTVRRVLRGAVVVAEDSTAPQADSQPARDERDDFEKVFPRPSGCIRCGTGYASTDYSNWAAHTHVDRWKGWQARAARAPADSVLEDAARWQTFIALPYATRAEWASNLSLAPVLTQWVDAARKQGANHD